MEIGDKDITGYMGARRLIPRIRACTAEMCFVSATMREGKFFSSSSCGELT
jgi:hypothetical protein